MSDRTYHLGRALGRNAPFIGAAAIATILVGIWISRDKTPEATSTAPTAPTVNPLVAECTEGIDDVIGRTRALVAQKRMEEAHSMIAKCRNFTDNASALALEKELLETVAKAARARLTKQRAEEAKVAARELAARKAAKKKEGVSIGMSQQDVLDSAWGRPKSVNRTTTAQGVREQWVYGGHNYLYFEDGVLVSIQN